MVCGKANAALMSEISVVLCTVNVRCCFLRKEDRISMDILAAVMDVNDSVCIRWSMFSVWSGGQNNSREDAAWHQPEIVIKDVICDAEIVSSCHSGGQKIERKLPQASAITIDSRNQFVY